ncbi:glycoside hydrolase family 55 protein [Hyaloscypha bicolor E]|uniref:Glycoside hydrolase family 55 protein n=1 Tax=Hyaloscypha bicolor E TaxID=1095630 RepID=A0A2J6TIS6_9HELO|nr:glycoside hydrolase family 55 protein [Hyaloscypha bicolor E]PMD62903.1 glycoside hydrolase family 55 protein [Hyaloscypha bicolor E]
MRASWSVAISCAGESTTPQHPCFHKVRRIESFIFNIQQRDAPSYWYENIAHQGISAFGPSGYQVYRNVKDFSAKGDGATDDTAAINAAINAGGRCGQGCPGPTVTPAVVYVPSGTYILFSSIVEQYYAQIISNPNDSLDPNWGTTNVFWRQVRNFVFDYSNLPINSSVCGIHWPTSQSTSLLNLVFQMSSSSGTQHVGIFSETGSADFMNDLILNGGNIGLQIRNQQFTIRNIAFNNVATTVSQLWSWGWLYQGLKINNCQRGIDISASGRTDQKVDFVVVIDSAITNTPVASWRWTLLAGKAGSTTITGLGGGNQYVPNEPKRFQGAYAPPTQPAFDLPASSFQSVRTAGAVGDGKTDDTNNLQHAINNASAAGNWTRLVGEAYPIIMSSGNFFNDKNNTKLVVQVGNAGQSGQVEWPDMIVSTQGAQVGVISIEWNLAASGTPSGMWDVHVRIGGFAVSNLQVPQCPKIPGNPTVNGACIAAYMLMHVTSSASNFYMENYQLASTRDLFMGFIQTETPYYQPTPVVPTPFSAVPAPSDPDFASSCSVQSGNCAEAWGLRIVNSKDVFIYGAGLYSFFNDYSITSSNSGGPENCQTNIFSLEGSVSNINVYCLSTVGTANMITQNGKSLASYSDNVDVFPDTIALFTTDVVPPTSSSLLGWNYRGGYTDAWARSLGNLVEVLGGAAANTIEACVEYSFECYCDNALRNGGGPAPEGDKQCTTPCSGKNGEICGGTFATPLGHAPAPGWNFKGCFTDSPCSGNSTEVRDGGNRLDLYTYGF